MANTLVKSNKDYVDIADPGGLFDNDRFTLNHAEDGKEHILSEGINITVLPEDPNAKVYKTREYKPFAKGGAQGASVTVCRLGDVYLYVKDDGHMVMTKNPKMRP